MCKCNLYCKHQFAIKKQFVKKIPEITPSEAAGTRNQRKAADAECPRMGNEGEKKPKTTDIKNDNGSKLLVRTTLTPLPLCHLHLVVIINLREKTMKNL